MAISIIKYNNKLIEENNEVNIIEYIKYVNTLEYQYCGKIILIQN